MDRLQSHFWRYLEQKQLERDPGQRRRTLRRLGMMRAPLKTLARLSGTDKVDSHEYIDAYHRFFSEYRNRRITLIEIGVHLGYSLNLWEAYFQRGTIIGVDIYDKTELSHGRVHVHKCSQTDRDGLERIRQIYGGFDLVIDDGSHVNQHQIESFQILFPMLKARGVYVIEDLQTSYWPAFGGGSVGTPAHTLSAMGFFTSLIDGLNHAEFLPPTTIPTTEPFHNEIRAIYFEHNLVAVLKGDNTAKRSMRSEATNMLTNYAVEIDGTFRQ